MSFGTSTRLWMLLAERINIPICNEKRSDTNCIKPMLFLWWIKQDSNLQQPAYEAGTLTSWAIDPAPRLNKTGGGGEGRTLDIPGMSRLLYQLSYAAKELNKLVELTRIELATLCLQSRCSARWATAPTLTKYIKQNIINQVFFYFL